MVFSRRSRRYRAHWSTRTYYEAGRDRRRRAPLIVLGAGLAAGGALVAFHALAGRGSLTGAALEIPAAVGTSAPLPATAPTAAPLARSVPVRIEIPALHVSAPVMRLGVAANGTVQVPPLENHNLTGWYDHSVTPGQRGSSVILGHVRLVHRRLGVLRHQDPAPGEPDRRRPGQRVHRGLHRGWRAEARQVSVPDL